MWERESEYCGSKSIEPAFREEQLNYLAHVMLALPDPDLVAGSFLADHIKGSTDRLSGRFRDGVILHRKVDQFVDDHSVVKKSKQLIRPPYVRYSGVLIDIFYDHFLAKHWAKYSKFPIGEVSVFTYEALTPYGHFIPASFLVAVDRLKEVQWLEKYGTMDGVHSSLVRVSSRGKRRHMLEDADVELMYSYDVFENHFLESMPDVCKFVNDIIKR